MKCDIVVAVWNHPFIDTFVGYFLPSLLAPDNLPAWPYLSRTALVIYTFAEQIPWIQHALDRLVLPVPIEWRSLDALLPNQPVTYPVMSLCHQDALQQARAKDAAVWLLSPDSIITDGTFGRVAQWLAEGKETILAMGLIADEAIKPTLEPYFKDQSLCLTPAQAFDRVLPYLSSRLTNYFWSFGMVGFPCFTFYWKEPGILACHGIYLHPIFMRHPASFLITNHRFDTIDGNYLREGIHDLASTHVAVDGLLMFSFGLTMEPPLLSIADVSEQVQQTYLHISEHTKQSYLFTFLDQHCNPKQKWLYTQELVFKGTEQTQGDGFKALIQSHPVLRCSFEQQKPEMLAHIQALVATIDVTRLYDEGLWEQLRQSYGHNLASLKPFLAPDLYTLVENYLRDVTRDSSAHP